MRCKACDSVMGENERLFREVEDESGNPMRIVEDLCRKCRNDSEDDEDVTVYSDAAIEYMTAKMGEWGDD